MTCNLCNGNEIITNNFIWKLEGYDSISPEYIATYCEFTFMYGYNTDMTNFEPRFRRRVQKIIKILMQNNRLANLLKERIQDLLCVKTCEIVSCEDYNLYLYMETTRPVVCNKIYKSEDKYNGLPLTIMDGIDFMGVDLGMRGLLKGQYLIGDYKYVSDFICNSIKQRIYNYLNEKFYVSCEVGEAKYGNLYCVAGCLKNGKLYKKARYWSR